MRILLIYHFFYPDSNISARLFSHLAEDFVKAGHQVTVFSSNHLIRSREILQEREEWNGVSIHRFSRPDFSQQGKLGRLFNSFILQRKWLSAFEKQKNEFDAVILGTDPQFAYFMFPKLHRLAPRTKLIHWCFDLYPEAVMAGASWWMKLLGKTIQKILPRIYRDVNVIADIDPCMRQRLKLYAPSASYIRLTPWALREPENVAPVPPEIRKQLFGDAKLTFLYSGSVGHAHDLAPFLKLARECRSRHLPVAFCFAGTGNCYERQTASITQEDTNITLAKFTSEEELALRLAAADFHLISLRPGWEGIVLPSKFFAALAMGRPVLYSGPLQGGIHECLQNFPIGFCLGESILEQLENFLNSPKKLELFQKEAFRLYHEKFSRKIIVQQFLSTLNNSGAPLDAFSHSTDSEK